MKNKVFKICILLLHCINLLSSENVGTETIETTNQESLAPTARNEKIPEASIKTTQAVTTSSSTSSTTTTTTTTTKSPTTTQSTKAEENLCILNFGRCIAKQNSNECSSQSALVHGICGDEDVECCIDNQQVQQSWDKKDVECDIIFGHCQLEYESCSGVRDQAACAGPTQRKCCSPTNEDLKSWESSDKKCLEKLGECKLNKLDCAEDYGEDMCGGPKDRQCCVPSKTDRDSWEEHDGPCLEKWGTCQSEIMACDRGTYEETLCGGPTIRQCCVPDNEELDSWPEEELECTKQFGICQHITEECNGTSTHDLCQGPSHRVCCKPDQSTLQAWAQGDETCLAVGGDCQNTLVDQCQGELSTSETCGGPKQRQCCVYHKQKKKGLQNLHATQNNDENTNNSHSQTRVALLITAGLLLFFVFVGMVAVAFKKKKFFKPYKRVREDSWFEKNAYDETVKLTSCEEKGAYA